MVGVKAKIRTLRFGLLGCQLMQRDHDLIRREDDSSETVRGARDGDTNDRRLEPPEAAHPPSIEGLSYSTWFIRRDRASWMTRVRQAQHRTMACAINRGRDVSGDWVSSVGASQLRVVCGVS
jgi:hypothetical protein